MVPASVWGMREASTELPKNCIPHLFEAAARERKRMGTVPLPSMESMEKESAVLTEQKGRLLTEYRSVRGKVLNYETIRQNVAVLFLFPRSRIRKT